LTFRWCGLAFFVRLYLLLGFVTFSLLVNFNTNNTKFPEGYFPLHPKAFNFNSLTFRRNYSTNKREILDPFFVTGLTEAEGSFSITKHKDARARFGLTTSLRFKITMLANELELLEKVKAFFGVGSIVIDDKAGSVDYIVRDKISLGAIKEHFI